ncbi:uncharacterized protein SCHCODRAFT_02617209 [Schizophyllum commune H4-8]|nr:uncharacterized protein SCHCODRAFT_02617209 [Schizophyllum commune H4-8]KAI5894528.1 hypothetical protein SCHCODRAFT_02617209 [Schizophyllum commune H4-8]
MTSKVDSEVPKSDVVRERLHELPLPDTQQRNLHDLIDPPVHRLPPEVVSEILLMVVFGNICASVSVFVVRHILSCVCGSWREVTRSTPALWNRVPSQLHSVSLQPHLIDYAKHASENATLSGALPLEIYHQLPADDRLLDELFEALRPEFHRVQTIIIEADFSLLDSYHGIDLPALQKAHLELHGQPARRPLNLLTKAAALSELRLKFPDDDDLYAELPALPCPALPVLTKLALEINATIPLAELLQALRACADSLTEMELQWKRTSQSLLPTIPLVQMNALRRISSSLAAHEILNHIDAPALEHVAIIPVCAFDDGDPFSSLSAFVSRLPSPGKITRLEANASTDNTDSFVECLAKLGGIRQLSMSSTAYEGLLTQGVFSRLTCVAGARPLLPRLTKLYVSFLLPPRENPEAEEALKEMIASRKAPRVCASREVAALESAIVRVW